MQTAEYYTGVVKELCKLSDEAEWVEFKCNVANNRGIGEYISALANAAALLGKPRAYIIWGVEDGSHRVVGTTFNPGTAKEGNELLENWLTRLLSPRLDFRFHELTMGDDARVVILDMPCAFRHPVRFESQEFIRVGSYKKNLKDHPEKERALWRVFDETPFEHRAAELTATDVVALLDYPAYFELLSLPLPSSISGILEALANDDLIARSDSGLWNITNLGAVLFAKRFDDFDGLKRKAMRVIVYKDNNRVETQIV